MNSSTYCLVTGRVGSLKELTTRSGKRKFDPSRPALPPAPNVPAPNVRANIAKRRRLVWKMLAHLFPQHASASGGRGNGSVAKLARFLDVPYADIRVMNGPAMNRIVNAIEKALESSDALAS